MYTNEYLCDDYIKLIFKNSIINYRLVSLINKKICLNFVADFPLLFLDRVIIIVFCD